jgi:hypothetical protein
MTIVIIIVIMMMIEWNKGGQGKGVKKEETG